MTLYLTIAVIALIFIVIFQIAKASEYVAILKGEKEANKQSNKLNGFMMILFLVLGLIGVWYCHELYADKTLFKFGSASEQGEKVDSMIIWTLYVTGAVFIATQVLLFYFSYKYQHKEGRKIFFLPHNNTVEIIWTVIPAIVLAGLVAYGLKNWNAFTSEAPEGALEVEVTGKQFGWIFRYPGADNQFGKKYFKVIDPASNSLGLVWEDNADFRLKDDKYTHDDIVTEQTVYIVKNRPVKFIIGSRDVIHDVGLSHFRMKMDAVPGIPTTMWFTPKYTTTEMQKKTGNPNFQYELSCDQMCGNGHYSMKGIIVVVDQKDYDAYMAKQKPYYYAAFPDKEPKPAVTDSTLKITPAVAKN